MRQKAWRGALWLAALGWLAFSLYLSWQPGDETAGLSMRIARFLVGLLGRVGLEFELNPFHMGLRLAAHFGVFFIDGVLLAWAFWACLAPSRRRGPKAFLWGAATGAVASVAAEVIKVWIPGRHLTWSETGLNVLGVLCGAGIVSAACALVCRRK